MNKLFTKIIGAALGLTMAIGVGVAVGNASKEAVPVEAAYGTKETLSCSKGTVSNNEMSFSTTSFDIVHAKGSGSNFAAYSPWRVYANNTVTISSKDSSVNIGKVEFVHSSTYYSTIACSTPSGGTITMATSSGGTSTWVIADASAANSVTFRVTGSSQSRWTSINIYPVANATLSSISVATAPTKTTYAAGECFNPTGLVITRTYSNSTSDTYTYADHASDFSFSPNLTTPLTTSNVSVSITYSGKTTSQAIVVKELSVIAVTTAPTKTTYTDGQSFDPTGMVVTATYSDASTADVTSSCTFTPDPLTEGLTQVTVSYGGETTTQAVIVNAAPGYAKITDLATMDKVFITSVKSSVNYLVPATTTSSGPEATTVTIVNNKVTGADESNLFTVEKSGDTYAFKNSDGKYLVNTNDNNGVRINTTTAAYWTITATTNGFKMTNNSRWLGVYTTSNWRSYTTSGASNYGGSGEAINFYGTTKEVPPLEDIELRDYPTSDVEIGYTCELSYYGLDSEAEEWTGDVVYTSSNPSAVTVDENGNLEAVAAGYSDITVYANAGAGGSKVESNPVRVTVLADPERIDLPIGNYSVNISASGKSKGDPIPDTSFEIKPKEGRTWYKNLTASYTDMSVQYSNEYSLEPSTGAIAFTNNSNAKITTVTIDWYTDNGYEASDLYVGSSATPASYTTSSGSGTVYIYSLNTDEDIRISNPSDSKRSSFYTMTINFEVADESEEFYSLVVSKDPSWDKTTYKDGQSPSNEDLVVTANFSNDGGETITRSVDVTSQVSNWAYTPSTLHTGDTSFSVVATWSEYESSAFSVTGITVEDCVGPIASGRYYIMTHDSACGMDAEAYTSSHPVAIDLSESNELTAFDVTLVADNEYEISTTIGDVKYYLVNNSAATSSANDNIKITNNPLSTLKSITWSLDAVDGGYNVKQNTTGGTYRYLSCYNSADWRGYVNTNNGDPVIKFVAEGAYANEIAEAIMSNETPLCNGGTTAPSVDRWNAIAGITHIQHELDILTNTEAAQKDEHGDTPTGTTAEKAMARYDEIMMRYNTVSSKTYVDFLGRIEAHNLPLNSSRAILANIVSSTNAVTIIVIISMVSISSIGGYFFLRTRKED